MSQVTNKEYDVTECLNCIIKEIPMDRLQDFYKELPEIVEWHREHNFISTTWLDDGENTRYIDEVK